MVIDTSVLVAVSRKETGYGNILDLLYNRDVYLSAASLQETYMVIYARQGNAGWREMDNLLSDIATTIVAVDESIAHIAMGAFARYGKGQGGKSRLNYGDCFSYATAKSLDEKLLFLGDDFIHTRVVPLDNFMIYKDIIRLDRPD